MRAGALASAPAPAAGVRVTITLPPPSPLSPILPEPGLVSVSTLRWRGSHLVHTEHVVTEEHRGASGARSDHCDKVITLCVVTHHPGGQWSGENTDYWSQGLYFPRALQTNNLVKRSNSREKGHPCKMF